jgi:hypothetical protein
VIELVEKEYPESRAWWVGDQTAKAGERILVLWTVPKLGAVNPDDIWELTKILYAYGLPGSPTLQ